MIRFAGPRSLSSRFVKHAAPNADVRRLVGRPPPSHQSRTLQTLSLQLDYYMSAQFAGIACGITNNLYSDAGIDLQFLPICPVGHELRRVRDHADGARRGGGSASSVTVGSVEQNIFIPTLARDPSLKVKAVAAMFRRSPLCLASLASSSSVHGGGGPAATDDGGGVVIGAHEDTVSLIERIVSLGPESGGGGRKYSSVVVASPRATKNTDLKEGRVGAIQAYTTTEVPTLERQLGGGGRGGGAVVADELEGMNGAKLGYSQMLFAPEEDLASSNGDRREVVQAFLDATFRGWEMAIRDAESAARSVDECRTLLGLDEENNDHWDSTFEYTVQNVGLCSDYVKETFQGDRYGVLDAERFREATEWLLDDAPVPDEDFGMDASIWQPPSNLLAGNELARKTMESAKKSAELFLQTHGRKPSLAVITVGELGRYAHAQKRLKLYSNGDSSWFSKSPAGEANGFDVREFDLPESTTTDEVLGLIYSLKKGLGVDGLQLMWPLPQHVDAAKCYNAIDVTRDADGAHYVGQLELDPANASPMPPVTPAAILSLIDEYGIETKNKSVLICGRSRIVGAPLAHMLSRRGAIVTVAHSEVAPDKLESLLCAADVVVSCVGSPGTLKADWLKAGAEVLNVGTTFVDEKETLCSDFDSDLAQKASRFSPVPGGLGPLSLPHLFKNVARAAWERAEKKGDVEGTWTTKSGSLERSFHFKDYTTALKFANKVNATSSEMDHHANIAFRHKCVNGVDVTLQYFTFEANEITEKDFEAANAVNEIAAGF